MSARPFFETLRDLRRGVTLAELADKLNELTAAVVSTGKPGKLTLELKLEPAANGAALVMRDRIKTTLPQGDRSGTIFYASSDFNLSRTDPNQMGLPLRSVDGPEPGTHGAIAQELEEARQ